MTTPVHSGDTLSTEPSRALLQRLLDEFNDSTASTEVRDNSSKPAQLPFRPVWVGGASIAEDARRRLRAADEARMRHRTSNAMDGADSCREPPTRVDSSSLHRHSVSAVEDINSLHSDSPPDPVSRPHDYFRYMSLGHEHSPQARPAVGELHLETSFLDLPVPSNSSNPRPVSPLIFSDVDFDTGSSHSGRSVSPTEAPTSATTITGDQPTTPSEAGSIQCTWNAPHLRLY